MTLVLDASVTVAWCFNENAPVANAALDLVERRQRALAPLLLWFELRNAILMGIRRGRTTPDRASEILVRIEQMLIRLMPLPRGDDVLELSMRHRLTFYDAAYLELALRENCPLATLDDALARAAATEGVALIGA